MASAPLGGGCLCGAVRYEITRVFDAVYCHCTRCRRTGAALGVFAYVEPDALRVTRGTPRAYRSSPEGSRCFCPACGSNLWFEARDARYYSVAVGTLDHPDQVEPQIHQCIETKLPWLTLADDLPRVQGNTLPHPDRRRK